MPVNIASSLSKFLQGKPTSISILWSRMMAPGIPLSKREVIFDRGQRVDTLRPGQGVGLAVAREITEQYEGKIVAGESMLGGARMEVIFGRQHSAPKDE